MRAQTYQTIGEILSHLNDAAVGSFLRKFKQLAKLLVKDSMHLPKMVETTKREPTDADQDVNNEAIELLVKLMQTDNDVMRQFVQAGADSDFIESLKQKMTEHDLGYEGSKAIGELNVIA